MPLAAIATTPLTRREIRFVDAWVNAEGTPSLAGAALAAYPELEGKPTSVLTNKGRKLLDKPNVRDAIARTTAAELADIGLDLKARLAKVLMVRAFYDPFEIIDGTGALRKPPEELGPWRVCVDGVETRSTKYGMDTVVRLADRQAALRELTRLMGIADGDGPGDGKPSVQVIVLAKGDLTPDEWNERFRQVEAES